MDTIEIQRVQQSADLVAALLTNGARKLRLQWADMRKRRAWRGRFEVWEQRGETASVLDALGLERGQIPLFISGVPAAARLLVAMMARIGVKAPLDTDAAQQQELLRVCALCPDQARCRQWLDAGETTGFEAFCPNASVFTGAPPATLREHLP